MKNKLCLFLILCALSFLSCNKINDIILPPSFNKVYGGSSEDEAYNIIATKDGGYAFVGHTKSKDGDVSGNSQASTSWVVKLDKNGNKLWQNPINMSELNEFYSIVATQDGGYIIAGYTYTFDEHFEYIAKDIWLVKLDKNGNNIWSKTYGGSSEDLTRSIVAAPDGGYIVAGYTKSNDRDVTGNHGEFTYDVWLIKVDENGNKLWQKTYGGTGDDAPSSIVASPDGGYALACYTNSSNGDVNGNRGIGDVWILKIDNAGNKLWSKTAGGSGDDVPYSITAGLYGGYAIAGYTESNNGDVTGNHGGLDDAWVIDFDKSGNKVWQKTLGGSDVDEAYSITSALDGGFTLIGITRSADGDVTGKHGGNLDFDTWVVAIDKNGNKLWSKALGGTSGDEGASILTNNAGGYIIAGSTFSTDGDAPAGNHGLDDAWVLTLKNP